MPWLSRSPSPARSPRLPALNSPTASPPITYIPPLIDGACGTLPRAQKQTLFHTLRSDASCVLRLLPEFGLAAWDSLVASDSDGHITTAGKERVSSRWRDLADLVLQLAISVVELNTILLATPIWLLLPGFFFFTCWLLPILCVVWGIARLLNPREHVHRQPWPAQGDADAVGRASRRSSVWSTVNVEGADERWFFVPGMSVSARTTKTTTLPLLSQLFNRPVTGILPRTYGLPMDMLFVLLARTLPALSPDTVLYNTLRCALQDNKAAKVVVLAHNTGAVRVSRVLSRLCADLPPNKLAKLELYTFGAAADEFVVPLGDGPGATETPGSAATSSPSITAGSLPPTAPRDAAAARRPGPHLEHFAHVRDPFARLGVLCSVREDLSGRFCGGVFVINGPGQATRLGVGLQAGQPGSPYLDGISSSSASRPQSPAGPRSPLHFSALGVSTIGADGLTPPASDSGMPEVADYDDAMATATIAVTAASAPATRVWLRKPLPLGLVSKLASSLKAGAPPVVSMQAYMAALFPEQVAGDGGRRASVLDSMLAIERDVAEKREFAAIASHASSASLAAATVGGSSSSSNGKDGRDKRLSWTGLGAMLNGGNSSSGNDGSRLYGIIGLEIARQGCRDCQGHRGREVSRLVRFVDGGRGARPISAAGAGGRPGLVGQSGFVIEVQDMPNRMPM